MTTQLLHRLMDAVEAVPAIDPDKEFEHAAFALLSLAISRLEPKAREAALQSIEDGALRRAVQKLEPCCQSAHDSTGWVQ